MKIFFFTNDYPPNSFGGVAIYISALSKALSQIDSHKVYVVHYLHGNNSEIIEEKINKNLQVLRIPKKDISSIINKEDMRNYGNYVVDSISDYINGEDAIFHVNCWPAVYVTRVLNEKYKYPIIFTQHSLEWQFPLIGNIKKLDYFWIEEKYKISRDRAYMEKEMAQIAIKVIAVSNEIKKLVIKSFGIDPDKINVVHNGLNISMFENSINITQKEKMKLKLGFNLEEKIIIYSGRLFNQKGIEYLIRAFKKVLQIYKKNIKLVIVGKGFFDFYLNECENIWSKVIFTGFLPYEKVIDFYSIADIGVVPSIWEPFGYTAIELMASGIPTIVSSIDGLNEIVTDGYDGLKVKVNEDDEGNRSVNIDELTDKIIFLLENEDEVKRLARNAKNTVEERFTAERMAKETLKVYENAVEEYRKINNAHTS